MMNTKKLARVCAPWLLAVAPMALSSCRTEQAGAVIVAMQTDMQVPKDITHVGVFVSYDGVIKMSRVVKVNAETENGRFVTLPSTLAVVSNKDSPGSRVRVRVMAFQTDGGLASDPGLRARVARDAVFTVPEERRVLLRMPLQFVSDGSAKGRVSQASSVLNLASHGPRFTADAIDFETGLGAFEFPCKDGKTDILGTCESWDVDSSKLPDYSERDVFGDAPGASCFSTKEAFSSVQTLPVAGCTVSLSAPDPSRVNFAFDTSGGQPCTDNSLCVAPMDGPGSAAPFYTVTPSTDGKLLATFVKGVCDRLGNKVTVGFGAPIKTDKQSVCSSATGGVAPVPGPSPEAGLTPPGCPPAWGSNGEGPTDVSGAEKETSGIAVDTNGDTYVVARDVAVSDDAFPEYLVYRFAPGSTARTPVSSVHTFEAANKPRRFTALYAPVAKTLALAVHGAVGGEKVGFVVQDGVAIQIDCRAGCKGQGATDVFLDGSSPPNFWFGVRGSSEVVRVQSDNPDLQEGVSTLQENNLGLGSSPDIVSGAFVPGVGPNTRRAYGASDGRIAVCPWPAPGTPAACRLVPGDEGGPPLLFATQRDARSLLFLRGEGGAGQGSGLFAAALDNDGLPSALASVVAFGRAGQTPFTEDNGLVVDGPNVYVSVDKQIFTLSRAEGGTWLQCPSYTGEKVRELVQATVGGVRYLYWIEDRQGPLRVVRRHKI